MKDRDPVSDVFHVCTQTVPSDELSFQEYLGLPVTLGNVMRRVDVSWLSKTSW